MKSRILGTLIVLMVLALAISSNISAQGQLPPEGGLYVSRMKNPTAARVIAEKVDIQPENQTMVQDVQTLQSELHVCKEGCSYRTVQAALYNAGDYSTIKIAGGTYTDVVTVRAGGIDYPGIGYVWRSLTIQGGYTTTNWNTSDPVANPTVLDAEGRGRVLTVLGTIYVNVDGLVIRGGNAWNLPGPDPNWTSGLGGGIHSYLNRKLTIKNVQFVSNQGKLGGGIFSNQSVLDVQAATFQDNSAANGGGGACFGLSTVNVEASTVVSNTGGGFSGGMDFDGSSATLSNNLFQGNNAGNGGAIGVLGNSNVSSNEDMYLKNTATVMGGAVRLDDSRLKLTNGVINDNRTAWYGGGIAAAWFNASAPQLEIVHSTFSNNQLDAILFGGEQMAITNTIIANHATGVSLASSSVASIINGVLWYNNTVNWSGGNVTVKNQVTGNPWFNDDGFHLMSLSAAIDKGVDAGVTTDIDGEPRPLRNAPDLGADEIRWDFNLAIKKEAPSEWLTGKEMTYTIHITNVGMLTAAGVMVTDTLPDGVSFVRAWPGEFVAPVPGVPLRACALDPEHRVICQLDYMLVDETFTVTIVVSPTTTMATITNVVEVASADPDQDPSDNRAQVSTKVVLQRTYLPVIDYTKVEPPPPPPDRLKITYESDEMDRYWIIKIVYDIGLAQQGKELNVAVGGNATLSNMTYPEDWAWVNQPRAGKWDVDWEEIPLTPNVRYITVQDSNEESVTVRVWLGSEMRTITLPFPVAPPCPPICLGLTGGKLIVPIPAK